MHVILTTHSDTGHCFRHFYGANNPTSLGEELERAEESTFDAERGDRTLLRTHELIVTRLGDGSGVVTHHLRRVNHTDYHAAIAPLILALHGDGLRLVEVEDVEGEWHVRQAPLLALSDVTDHELGRTLSAHTVPAELVERSAWEPSRGTVTAAALAQSIGQRWGNHLRRGDAINAPVQTSEAAEFSTD